MNKQETNSIKSSGRTALLAWLIALSIFLLALAWTILRPQAPPSWPQASPDLAQEEFSTVLEGLPAPGSHPPPDLPFTPAQEYVLLAAGAQGFYQSSAPDKFWSLGYSTPQLNAQLIKRGPSTLEIVSNEVKISWELSPQSALSDGSDARQGWMNALEDSYFQADIPVTALQTDATLNPYPLIKLRAVDNSGRVLAESAAVLAVSPGFGCASCHTNAGTAILEVHDRHQGTKLLEQSTNSVVVACRGCHTGQAWVSPTEGSPADLNASAANKYTEDAAQYLRKPSGLSASAAVEAAQSKIGEARPPSGLSVSAAIHGWHAAYLSNMGANACMSCHISLGRTEGNQTERPVPLFARDLHIDRGLSCVSCHGYMEDHALALLLAAQEAGQPQAQKAIAKLTAREEALLKIKGRQPWIQQPDCTSCHNFLEKPNPLKASAFNKWTDKNTGAAALFSARKDDMSALRCISCHGAAHAVYPARNILASNLDNMQPLQYQEQAATLGAYGNCALCHGQSMEFSAHHPLVERSSTKIHTPPGAKLSMPVAVFSHQAHSGLVNCTVCHHTGHEDGQPMRCTSAGCHDGISPTLPNKHGQAQDWPNPGYFRQAFHGALPSCTACHTAALAAGKAAGPTDCKACHQAPSARWHK